MLLRTVNNHLGRHSILLKQQRESLTCIPLLSHGKQTRPSKICDKYLGILVATLGLGSGKQSVTKNIMSQPPVLQLPVNFFGNCCSKRDVALSQLPSELCTPMCDFPIQIQPPTFLQNQWVIWVASGLRLSPQQWTQ